jgi:hypothetical protein
MRGEHGLGDAPPNPQYIVLDVTVGSDAAPERLLEMLDWGREHCPLSVLVGKAIPVHERVVANGTTIRDTVPDSAA